MTQTTEELNLLPKYLNEDCGFCGHKHHFEISNTFIGEAIIDVRGKILAKTVACYYLECTCSLFILKEPDETTS